MVPLVNPTLTPRRPGRCPTTPRCPTRRGTTASPAAPARRPAVLRRAGRPDRAVQGSLDGGALGGAGDDAKKLVGVQQPGNRQRDRACWNVRKRREALIVDLLLAFPKLVPGQYSLRAEMADFTGAAVSVRAKYFYQFGSDALMATIHVK